MGLSNTPTESLEKGNPYPNEYTGYDNKLHLMVRILSWSWGRMQSTLSIPLLPGSLWLGVEVSVEVLSMGQIELFDILLGIVNKIKKNSSSLIPMLCTNNKYQCLKPFNYVQIINSNTRNHLTVRKQMNSDTF